MTDIVIIGGGIVGLATAYRLTEKNPALKLVLIEKETGVSQHQTGHNSGVIHSGIYYKPGSMKAVNCTGGYRQLLEFCDQFQIPYDICGKIIVATDEEQTGALQNLFERGRANGLEGLKMLGGEELKEHEPYVNGISGIHVPQTGIIDFKEVSVKLFKLLTSQGVDFHFGEKVTGITHIGGETRVNTSLTTHTAKLVVNCAGLYSDKIARYTIPSVNVKIVPFRGEYFRVKNNKSYLVNNLIYPVPDPAFPFLGVHFTRMIGGGIEAGPNAVLAFSREGYRKSDIRLNELLEILGWPGFQKVAGKYWKTGMGEMYRSFSKSAFTNALQKLIPDIRKEDLETGGSGVRAQACDKQGGLSDDFLIFENEYAVNICNAPSPAATSCFSIGHTVSDKVLKKISD